MKTIGLIISHKNGERRRALLPKDIEKNVKNPQQLFFEEGYGLSVGVSDDEYRAVGCNIVSREEALACDVITDVKLGIIYILFMLVLQQIEGNIIEPAIMEDKTGLGKFWIVFALLVFGGLFGVVGMIISVPAFAIVYYLIKIRVNGALEAKSLPVDNDSYLNIKGIDESSNKLIVSEHNAPGGFWIAARKRIKVQAEERRKRKAEKKKNKK